jgi:hypothetical protein
MMNEEDDFDISFLDSQKLKESNQKLEDGTLTCNMDSPEECENCGS